jgi:hypothetical protein
MGFGNSHYGISKSCEVDMNTKPIRIKLLFEPRDLWIGVFWDGTYLWQHYDKDNNRLEKSKKLHTITLRIYICIVPMLPILIALDIQRLKMIFKYPWIWGHDLKSTYKSIWLGWWLITFTYEGKLDDLSISFQPGL